MKEQIEELKEIERMAYEMERLFIEAEIRQTLPKKHPSIIKAEALYNAGYRKQSEGEWIIKGNYFQRLVCTNCSGFGVTMSRYCPNCGAHMQGEKNG